MSRLRRNFIFAVVVILFVVVIYFDRNVIHKYIAPDFSQQTNSKDFVKYDGQTFSVIKVIDGDTFTTASRKNPVRLANVNAPEKGRPGAAKATQALRGMIGGKEVTIKTVARDVYGRSVANVKKGQISVNKAMRAKTKK